MSDRQLERTYVLEASEAEHARLIDLARGSAETVQEMYARAGVTAGARLIDIGCGPVGALPELAEIAGPRGTVVGIDSSAEAIETARRIIGRQNLSNVEVIHGDVNAMDLSAVTADGSFDAAHLRLVLSHQADPAAMLRRVATLLRPGGKVLAFDLLANPRYDPPVPASEQAWELMYAAARRRGATPVGAQLPRLCEVAGLRVLDARVLQRSDTSARTSRGNPHASPECAHGDRPSRVGNRGGRRRPGGIARRRRVARVPQRGRCPTCGVKSPAVRPR